MPRPSPRALLSLVLSLAVGCGVGVGLVLLARWLVPQAKMAAHNDAVGAYLQTIGTVFAVLLAFVVFVVWSQYNEARTTVAREANEVADLFRTVGGLPPATRTAVRDALCRYVAAVADVEWVNMARGVPCPHTAIQLDELWHALESFEPTTSREQALYGEALARFNDLSDHRTHRLLGARMRLPPTMWTLLVVGALLTVGSMALFGVPALWSHVTMTAALAGLVCFVLYVVYDLDDPFWGAWQVTAEPLRDAVAEPGEVAGRRD